MKNLNKIYQNLDRVTTEMNSNQDDVEYYQMIDTYLQEYLDTEKKEFIYQWYDDFFEKYCELTLEVDELLSNQNRHTYKKASNFFKKTTRNNYILLIKSFYPLSLSVITSFWRNKEHPFNKTEIGLLFFITLSYFPKDEVILFLKAFDYYIKKDIKETKLMDSKNTIFPLVYHIANEYIGNTNIDDETKLIISEGISEFKFNDLYKEVYKNYLSKEEVIVNNSFKKMCNYHLKKSIHTDEFYSEFEYSLYQAIPIEVLMLLILRKKKQLGYFIY